MAIEFFGSLAIPANQCAATVVRSLWRSIFCLPRTSYTNSEISELRTHEVFNQPPPLENYNLLDTDRALQEAVDREGAAWAKGALSKFGEILGRGETIQLGTLANKNPTVLCTHDRYGNRRDDVEFHPAWHEMMSLGIAEGVHSGPWADSHPGAHVACASAYHMYSQIENGSQCPLTMTYAVVPVVR